MFQKNPLNSLAFLHSPLDKQVEDTSKLMEEVQNLQAVQVLKG